jgi:hypothetical protein
MSSAGTGVWLTATGLLWIGSMVTVWVTMPAGRLLWELVEALLLPFFMLLGALVLTAVLFPIMVLVEMEGRE